MIKNLPYEEQPREKLVTHGVSFLSNSELLAILLRTGTRNKSAIDLGRTIVNKFGNNINDLSQVTLEELCSIDGIGESKATQIISAIELGKRIKQTSTLRGLKITSPTDVVTFFSMELSDASVEKFVVVLLNTKNEVINWEIISIGSLNASIVHPREVYSRAIKRSAASIIAIHNHPSGTIEPSREDLAITKRLSESGQLVGIPLIDHIIIGKECYYSFKEQNQL